MAWIETGMNNQGGLSGGGIYGVEWDGSSSTIWLRTDDSALFAEPIPQMSNGSGGWTQGSSPFDKIMPWAGMVRITDSEAGELVAIPKYYFKLSYANTTEPKGLKIQISSKRFPGSQISPAHMDRGDGKGERDVIYVGRYHCTSNLKSTAQSKPVVSMTRDTFRNNIHNLGTTIWQWDYATLLTIQMLYLVEYANWDSQSCIGYGCASNSSGNLENNGFTDSMTYHTGTNKTSKTTFGFTQYRYIEALWANGYDFVDGIYFNNSDIYIIKNPAYFSDTTNGTKVGDRCTTTGITSKYYISSTDGFTWMMFPSEANGTTSTYICDYYGYISSGTILIQGARANNQNHGIFCLQGLFTTSQTSPNVTSRLMKLP